MIWPGNSQISSFSGEIQSPSTPLYNFNFNSDVKQARYHALVAEVFWPGNAYHAFRYESPNSGVYFDNLQDLSGFEEESEFRSYAVLYDWGSDYCEHSTWSSLNADLITKKLKHNMSFHRIRINFAVQR